MERVGRWWRRAAPWVSERAEWVLVVVALAAGFGGTRHDPNADSGAYAVGTIGVEALLIGLYVIWLVRPHPEAAPGSTRPAKARRRDHDSQTGRGRRVWIAFVGVPVAVMLVALPDLLAGHMNDDRTGTGASVALFALILFVGVLAGGAVGYLVLLPLGWILRTAVLALLGKSDEGPLIVLAAFPLVLVGYAVSGAVAIDDPPNTAPYLPNVLATLGAAGFASLLRAFGVHNGARIVDGTALIWFRVFAIVVGAYLVLFIAASGALWTSRSGTKDGATARDAG
jgi:hypothetical protein